MVTVEFDSMGEAVRMAGRSAASGMARYPPATVAGRALAGMGGRLETLEEALGSTVVVEYESSGDGGLGRARAPHRRPEVPGRRVGALRRLGCRRGSGGGAGVRVGFAQAVTSYCLSGRTV